MIKKNSTRTDEQIKQYLENELWTNAFEYRKLTNFGKNAISYWEAHNGNHWDARKVKPKKAAAVLNQIGATIEDVLSNITDSPPIFDVIPSNINLEDEANVMKDVFNKYLWRKSRMDSEIQIIVRCALVVGSGHFRTECCPETRAIKTRYTSPFSCFPAPFESRIDDMPYYIQARLIPKIILQERFGDEIKDIRKTRNIAYEFMPDMEMEAAKGMWAGIKESARQVSYGLGSLISRPTENLNDQERLLIREFWVKDLEKAGGVRKYPTWRYYVMVEDVMLKSISQVWQYPFIPICKIDDYTTEGYWGRGEVEWMLSPQFLINKFMSQICNYMDLVANPPVKAEIGSGVTNENWVTRAGEILNVNTGFFDKVDFMRVPMLPPEFVGLINNLLKILDSITGQHAGMPTRTAAQAMLFSEAEQSRTRPKIRNLENGLLEWAEQCKEYVKLHWMSGKEITIRDDDGRVVSKSFKDMEALDEMNLTISTGSTAASSKLLKMDQVMLLPELDLQTKLETLGWANPKELADKIEAKQGELTQIKTQMGQMLQENQGLQQQLAQMTKQMGGG